MLKKKASYEREREREREREVTQGSQGRGSAGEGATTPAALISHNSLVCSLYLPHPHTRSGSKFVVSPIPCTAPSLSPLHSPIANSPSVCLNTSLFHLHTQNTSTWCRQRPCHYHHKKHRRSIYTRKVCFSHRLASTVLHPLLLSHRDSSSVQQCKWSTQMLTCSMSSSTTPKMCTANTQRLAQLVAAATGHVVHFFFFFSCHI